MKSTLQLAQSEMIALVTAHAVKAFRGSEVQVESITANLGSDHQPDGTYSVSVDVTAKERERKERKKLTDAERLQRAEEKAAELRAQLAPAKGKAPAMAKV